jgi:hypothetical protein
MRVSGSGSTAVPGLTLARTYQQHGLHTLKRRLKVSGLAGIDGRSVAARELLRWRRELEADLGGAAVISAQMAAVIDLAATSKLLLDSVDRYLLELPCLVNKKRRAVYPVVLQRQQLADALSRYMAQLGLERRPRPTLDLATYVAQRYGAASDEIPNRPQDRRSAAPASAEPAPSETVEPEGTTVTTQPADAASPPPPGDPASRSAGPPSDTQGETDRCLRTPP